MAFDGSVVACLKEELERKVLDGRILKVAQPEKDELIGYYKDFKAKLSTKAVGESLEVYCHNEFEKVRSMAYPRAYFEKDNVVSKTGSKGDFVFKDYDENGLEFISIMFEMKNELDTTSTKHRNEDFLKELDKDVAKKKAETIAKAEKKKEPGNCGCVPSLPENVCDQAPVLYPAHFAAAQFRAQFSRVYPGTGPGEEPEYRHREF